MRYIKPLDEKLVLELARTHAGIVTVEDNAIMGGAGSAVAELLKFTNGTQNSSAFNSSGLGAINRSGRTQLKLRFSANPTATRYVTINGATAATLRVEYQVP